MAAEKRSENLKAAVLHQHTEQYESTCNAFRMAYYIAQQDRPYTDHPQLLELQQLNGLDVGRVLHSNVVCADIVDHIANERRRSLVQEIVNKRPLTAVLIDESTSLNQISCLIV